MKKNIENNNNNIFDMNIFLELINKLPCDVIKYIEEFMPISKMIFVKKTLYLHYHEIVKSLINPYNYEFYIRDVIMRDNNFVLEQILRENLFKWLLMTKYYYKSNQYVNYYVFLKQFAFNNYSNKCYDLMSSYLLNSKQTQTQT